jgi:hypothetical protein
MLPSDRRLLKVICVYEVTRSPFHCIYTNNYLGDIDLSIPTQSKVAFQCFVGREHHEAGAAYFSLAIREI